MLGWKNPVIKTIDPNFLHGTSTWPKPKTPTSKEGIVIVMATLLENAQRVLRFWENPTSGNTRNTSTGPLHHPKRTNMEPKKLVVSRCFSFFQAGIFRFHVCFFGGVALRMWSFRASKKKVSWTDRWSDHRCKWIIDRLHPTQVMGRFSGKKQDPSRGKQNTSKNHCFEASMIQASTLNIMITHGNHLFFLQPSQVSSRPFFFKIPRHESSHSSHLDPVRLPTLEK